MHTNGLVQCDRFCEIMELSFKENMEMYRSGVV